MARSCCRRLAVVLAIVICLGAGRAVAAPLLEKIDLFEAGKDGYALYRIPGIVVTRQGTVLAYCEARKSGKGDWGHIDVVMRRSTDGGKTWQPRQQIVHLEGKFDRNPAAVAQKLGKDGEITINNPVAIADSRSGAVHFLFCVEYGRCFYQRSDDDGQSFTRPVEITSVFERLRGEYPWKVLATGPGHGIQLRSGRVVVPVWLSTGTGGHAHRPSVVTTVYSDDAGKTWLVGDIAAPNALPLINPNESCIAELPDGPVMLNIRSESKEHRRAVAFSRDGATGWSKPAFDDALLEPICMASLVQLEKGPLVFANPNNLTRADGKQIAGQNRDRKNVSIKVSNDSGKTWPLTRSLEPGSSGYSDLAATKDGTILCFYERRSTDGGNYSTGFLTVARFNLEWATSGEQR